MDFFTAHSQAASPPQKKARIEIIPLIDVIFFLLATFILFTLSLDKIQSIPVTLPQASANPSPLPDDTLVVIQVSSDQTAYWNREPITFDDLPPRLAAHRASSPSPRVLVTGDDTARYGDAVRVLDQVRLSGITLVSIETAPRPAGR